MLYGARFGTYYFPPTLHISSVSHTRIVPAVKLPRAHGSRIPMGFLKEKHWIVQGGMGGDVLATAGGLQVQGQLEDLKAGLAQGPTTFLLNPSRYYRNCQVVDYDENYASPMAFYKMVEVSFSIVAADPFGYTVVATNRPTNAVTISPTTVYAIAGGSASAVPTLSLTVGGSGAVTLAATLTNTTTGEAFTLAGAVAGGDVLVVNGLDQTVTIGGVDKTSLFDGQFLSLAVGVNALTVAYSSGTITNVGLVWNDRWYS